MIPRATIDLEMRRAYIFARSLDDDTLANTHTQTGAELTSIQYDATVSEETKEALRSRLAGYAAAIEERARYRLAGMPVPDIEPLPEEAHGAVPLRALSLGELAVWEFPPVEWIVDDLLPAGALGLLVGRPKAGKSLLAVDLVASVALGETFIGRATAQGTAVYVPAEDALRLVRDRLWTRLSTDRTAPLFVIPADGTLEQGIRLDDHDSMARLAATIADLSPSLLILDPLRELHHRKENDADEMAAVLRPLRQLAHDTGTAILLVHHRNKHATDASIASRGSSAIVGSVDVLITLDLTDESDSAELTPDQTMTLRIEGRYGPRQRLAARLRTGLRWEPTDAATVDDLGVRGKIIRHLEVTAETPTADELHAAIGGAKSGIQTALRELMKSGKIARDGNGSKTSPYRYKQALYEPLHESFRDGTRKTEDSYKAGIVYASGFCTNPDGDTEPATEPICQQCGTLLRMPETIASGICTSCQRSAVA